MPLTKGQTFAGYKIIRQLGAGGMGEVYLAQHPRLPRQDALKVLRTDVSDDGEFRERFIREADLAASLSHPNILTVHDRGEYDGQLWIATSYVDGTDAAQVIREQYPAGLPVDQVRTIVTAIASALDYAHDRGLLHRDVKPANILLSTPDKDGQRRIFLADFGIARPIADANGLTATNLTVGTVAYAAPEQLMGEDLDGRADQYALAATAYHLLTGTPLYDNTNPVAVISHHLSTPAPALSDRRPDLASLDGALRTGLSKDRGGRFANCRAFAQALCDASGSSPTRTAVPQADQTIAADKYREPIDQPAIQASQLPARRRRLIALVAAGAAMALVATGLYIFIAGPRTMNHPLSAGSPTDVRGSTLKSTTTPKSKPSSEAGGVGEPAHKVEVSFTQIGNSLNVRLHNPNPDVGLVRSPFELALLDDSGAIIANLGDQGLPGSAVSTIYQLPPNGDFGFSSLSAPPGKTVASMEFTVTGKWLEWGTLDPPQVTIKDATTLPDSGYSGPSVTGRLSLDKDGPLNAIVVAFVKTSAGTVVSTAFSDCLPTGQPRVFQTKSFDEIRGPYELESVVAYATSVKGAGSYSPTC
ncbi:serine/threonine protein kinase [Mycobacterium paragordonae]|uniref:serine/threonine-protein kinase n=1 Tax=Mycobacterium paragordonae TaxID=1389713 RepID=UPI00106199E6|nr:serine/threonine-protein kinase [Mycobacterium paragordonae]TDK96494.1 serine/threonine protein kinase [Mycobacterium paragordonae]